MSKITKEIDLYEELLSIYKENTILANVNSLMHWDYEVMMPKKATQQRAEELALMSGLIHERIINPKIGNLLKEIKAHPNFDKLKEFEQRNIVLIQRDYDKETKIPVSFAQELSKHGAISTQKWKEAKSKADYSIFRNELEKMIVLKKQEAAYLEPDKDPYDVLLERYEYGFSKAVYDRIFDEIKTGLIPIIKSCIDSSNQPDDSLILREVPIDFQNAIAHDLAKIVEYDFKGGRIDVAVHPFTTGYYDDVRFTIAYNKNDFTDMFYATMHEAGHALYEQNLPPSFKYQPTGTASSSAMHEGQARFIENIIGRSPEFLEYYLPRLKKLTGTIFADVQTEPFIHAVNKVSPSKIRIHADPATYSLHIIVRYELEKELFNDKVTINELPDLWNEKMHDYLGIEITNDAEGILQDTHYAWGLFGYFPTYALGSYYNAQILTKLEKDIPDMYVQMGSGKVTNILKWLNQNIRNQGNLYDPLDLIKRVSGNEFSAKYFIDRTRNKYSKLYGF
ncbi:MAG: carboxypeptidase M32 [Candidatus Heimdallarchaeota archaeon]|nr:carboxypeptidase M32 [Candidatus Heimdallarchaeota archaeon]